MRLPPALGRGIFFAALFFFALVALMPLRLAIDWLGLDRLGLAAREASGSIWLGALKEAQLGPVPLGDVEVRLDKLPLLIGRSRLSFEREELDAPLSGAVTSSGGGFSLDDFTGQVRLGAALAPLPIGSIELSDVSVRYSAGLCESAEGRVRALPARELSGLASASGLGGNIRCGGGMLLLPLASESGSDRLTLQVRADGRYRADLFVQPSDPTLRNRLVDAGFRPSGTGLRLRLDGAF